MEKSFQRLAPHHIDFFTKTVGSDHVLLHDLDAYNIDWTGKFKGQSQCVIKPKTTEQISHLLAYCSHERLAVVPQGGNTGLVGSGVPLFDEIIINMQRMNSILSIDEEAGMVTCEAGCILENLENALHEKGYMMPLDLGSKGSCQIGGNISTNAGGLRLIRYGSLHGTVLSLKVVLANGKILELGHALRKDNTGYDLKHLFIGAEGTLGIITEMSILVPRKSKSIQSCLLGLDSFEKALETFKVAKDDLGEILSAYEFFDQDSYCLTMKHFNYKAPFDKTFPFYVLLETSGAIKEHDDAKMDAFLEHVMEKNLVLDGIIAQDKTQANAIWNIRESISSACNTEGNNHKYDLSTNLRDVYAIVQDAKKHFSSLNLYNSMNASPIRHIAGFGHLGDGNIHLNIMTREKSLELSHQLDDFVYHQIQRYKGSISAEHGIGALKPNRLELSKSLDSINLMKNIKQLLDPLGM